MAEQKHKVVRRRPVTVKALLLHDRPDVRAVLAWLSTEYKAGRLKHILVAALDSQNTISVSSDLSDPAEILVLEQAKTMLLGGNWTDATLDDPLADELFRDMLQSQFDEGPEEPPMQEA